MRIKADDKENKKDLPSKILSMIFEEYSKGISIGEIKDILQKTEKKAEDITMILDSEI